MKTLRNLAIAVAITLFLPVACISFIWIGQTNFYIELLPEKIEAKIKYSSVRCFFAVFDLSSNTVEAINQQGINFFKDATKARAYDSKKNNSRMYSRPEWQKTPVRDTAFFNERFWVGPRCIMSTNENFDQDLLEKILTTAYSEGSFYTGYSKGQIVVMPSLGIVVISGPGD